MIFMAYFSGDEFYSTLILASVGQSLVYFVMNNFFDIGYGLLYTIWFSLRIYMLLVDIRFIVSWLLFINPYFEPLETIWKVTDPVFKLGVKLYPRILGMQSAPLFNMFFLQLIEGSLSYVCHMGDPVHMERFYHPQDWVRPAVHDIRLYDQKF